MTKALGDFFLTFWDIPINHWLRYRQISFHDIRVGLWQWFFFILVYKYSSCPLILVVVTIINP